jgi:hypothetical protein
MCFFKHPGFSLSLSLALVALDIKFCGQIHASPVIAAHCVKPRQFIQNVFHPQEREL